MLETKSQLSPRFEQDCSPLSKFSHNHPKGNKTQLDVSCALPCVTVEVHEK